MPPVIYRDSTTNESASQRKHKGGWRTHLYAEAQHTTFYATNTTKTTNRTSYCSVQIWVPAPERTTRSKNSRYQSFVKWMQLLPPHLPSPSVRPDILSLLVKSSEVESLTTQNVLSMLYLKNVLFEVPRLGYFTTRVSTYCRQISLSPFRAKKGGGILPSPAPRSN